MTTYWDGSYPPSVLHPEPPPDPDPEEDTGEARKGTRKRETPTRATPATPVADDTPKAPKVDPKA